MKFSQDMLCLYAVSDRGWTGRQSLAEQLEAALRGGVTLVQLREKTMAEADFIREALQIKALCHRYHVPLLINDDLDVALAAGADGVHVGMEDMPIAEIRRRVPEDFIVGATAKSVAQAQAAERDGADYLGVGAVFPSPTKTQAIRISPAELREICASVAIPAVAIGGINADNLAELAGCGMAGIAVVSALFAAADIEKTAAELKAKVQALL